MTLRRVFTFASFLPGLIALALAIPRFARPAPTRPAPQPTASPAPTSVAEQSFNGPLPPLLTPAPDGSIARTINIHTDIPTRPRVNVITYTVVAGDTPWLIAKNFNLQPESILWANESLSAEAGNLSIGRVLNILPTDGVLHFVREGDTLERLQVLYGVPIEDILNYPGNNLPAEPPYTLVPGQQVIVPGGRKPIVWQEPGPKVVAGLGRKSPGFYQGSLVLRGTGTFVWPVPPNVITQYFWAGHPGLDIDTYTGQPVYASDSGTVIFSGWDNTGYGNLIIIDHGNDFWTYYAHNDRLLVTVGEGVVQGQQIAESGSTGRSTGSHLDFRIRYQAGAFLNPLNFLP